MMAQSCNLVSHFFLFSIILATASAATTGSGRLYTCVQDALIGSNVQSRIVSQSDSTYPDARVGTIV